MAVPPVAVIVIDAADPDVGVPDTTPVDELIDSPSGSVPPVTAYETAPVKSEGVNAVEGVIAVPAEPDTVWVVGKTDGGTTTVHVSVHDVVADVSYVFVNDPVFAAKKADALAPRVACVPA
jgi:hypothetical protein